MDEPNIKRAILNNVCTKAFESYVAEKRMALFFILL